MTDNSSRLIPGIILPVPYLPSIDQYCYIVQSHNVLFEIFETWPKQTCRNRTLIITANGPLRLSVPVIKPYGNKTRTLEVIIDNKTPWNKIHWKAIASAYNKSPFFLYYRDELEYLFMKAEGLLIDFNMSLITQINKFLKISPQTEYTTSFVRQYEAIPDKRSCSKDTLITDHTLKEYTQVFSDRIPFTPNLSILDLLFNEGPQATFYLKNSTLA